MWMRGGTSKGAYFVASDLPDEASQRDALLLRAMGSPDERQIDGIGGAHPLTSKVAVVGPSSDAAADLDYLFLQVAVDEPQVTDRQGCGNLLAGVGAFAVERGLVAADDPTTSLRIRLLNTGGIAVATLETPEKRVEYAGETVISGVPGSAAPVVLTFEATAGSSCGQLLPTGRVVDVMCGIEVTCIDNGMPVAVLRAADLGVRGDESPAELEGNGGLRETLELIRLEAGKAMGLGDVRSLTVPKLTLVSPPRAGGNVCTRTFIPHRCHDAIGVFGAVSVATACLLPGSSASRVARIDDAALPFSCEHPTGAFEIVIELDTDADGGARVRRAGVIRTARKLFDGVVFPRD